MRSATSRFLKNAASNVITSGASALLALVLPYFFVRIFRPAEFSMWVLVLQLAAYVNFLNFGVQVAIGRFIAHSLVRNRMDECEQILGAGLQILAGLAALGLIVIVSTAVLLPFIFRKLDPGMIGTARIMLIWIGSALALSLPFTAYSGVFVGMQRNDVPAVIALFSKALLAVTLIVTAYKSHSLVDVALAYFIASAIGCAVAYLVFRINCRNWGATTFSAPRHVRRKLMSYCLSASALTLAMLLIRGVDLTIVGIYDFQNVGAYGVSGNLIALFVGFLTSVTAPLLQIFTTFYAKRDGSRLGATLNTTSLLITIVLLVSGAWLLLSSQSLFDLWVGKQMAVVSVPIFAILVIANIVRGSGTPYSLYVLSVGMQRKIYLSPFIEGVVNLIASILLAKSLGAIGVAWGTLIGSTAAIAVNFLYNFKRTVFGEPTLGEYLRNNLQTPFLVSLPMLAVLVIGELYRLPLTISVPCLLFATIPSTAVARRKYRDLGKLKSVRETVRGDSAIWGE